MRPALLPVLLLAATGAAHGAGPPGWRCTAGSATAYRPDPARDRWETLVFPVAGQAFRVLPAPGGWALWRDGGDAPLAVCTPDDAAGLLRCGDGFVLDGASLLFESRLFTPPTALGELTAATVTGRCQPL